MEVKPGYKQTEVGVIPEDWEIKSISQLAPLQRGFDLPTREIKPGLFPVVYSNGIENLHDTAMVKGPGVVTGRSGTLGKVHYIESDYWPHNTSLWVTRFNKNNPKFIYYLYKSLRFERFASGSGVPTLNRNDAHSYVIAVPPTETEQRAIATALSDVDALLDGLNRLIAKKQGIKQATMQQLLTGKTRLPGFSGNWDVKPFSAVLNRLNAKLHQIQTNEYQETGKFPVVDQGKEFLVSFSDWEDKRFRCPIGGVIVFGDHTCIVKFIDFDFLVGADGTQIIHGKHGQNTRFHALQLQYRGIETTGYNRHFKFLKEREFFVPPLPEQTAIASVLSEMDSELVLLEQRRDKTRALKQAMMQELLTGKTRLVQGGI